jgi:hypothetical protein
MDDQRRAKALPGIALAVDGERPVAVLVAVAIRAVVDAAAPEPT